MNKALQWDELKEWINESVITLYNKPDSFSKTLARGMDRVLIHMEDMEKN